MLKGFIDFVREQGVVALAVGIAIGVAANETVKEIVEGFIDPVVGFILGSQDLGNMTWTVVSLDERELTIGWGAILSSVITLLATAFVIYFIVHKSGLDKLDKKK